MNLWHGECDPKMYSLISFDKCVELRVHITLKYKIFLLPLKKNN